MWSDAHGVSEGRATPSAPVTAVRWGNRFALFIADPNGGIYTAGGDPQGGFGPWASVSEGRSTPGAPVTAVPWGNRFALFIADPNGGIYTAAGDPQGGFGPLARVSEGRAIPGAPVTAVRLPPADDEDGFRVHYEGKRANFADDTGVKELGRGSMMASLTDLQPNYTRNHIRLPTLCRQVPRIWHRAVRASP